MSASIESTVAGAALDTIGHLLGGPRIDDLLARAAARTPHRIALRTETTELSYAELDVAVSAFASALRSTAPEPGTVVALTSVLDPSFAIAYYGISRAGHISAIVNPFLRADGIAHALSTSNASVAIVSRAVYRQLREIPEARIPRLRTIVLIDGHDGLTEGATVEGGTVESEHPQTLQRWLASTHTDGVPPNDVVPTDDETAASIATVMFTSGTTGEPKAVQLSHRNLTINAAQTAAAHEATADSVLFNNLPTCHIMHLNLGVCVGATHVLHPDADPSAAVRAARAHNASHYYSLPVRLIRLANDPSLAQLAMPSVLAILSGGSALPIPATTTLAEHFGIPVIQGYGLAELSPSTHAGPLDAGKPGSCGQVVPGTECRAVDVETGTVLPRCERGEIQLRGPQLMRGYLDRPSTEHLDADGWFRTGDIGYVDDDGYLFITDRLKDVFKCDNWLVSPTEIERVLASHPGVAECVVFDQPDEFSGAVAVAMVVPTEASTDPAALGEFVDGQVPYYQRLRRIELVESIPRSANGKIRRSELRLRQQ